MKNIQEDSTRLYDVVMLKNPNPNFGIGQIIGIFYPNSGDKPTLYIQDLLSDRVFERLPTHICKVDIAKIHIEEILC